MNPPHTFGQAHIKLKAVFSDSGDTSPPVWGIASPSEVGRKTSFTLTGYHDGNVTHDFMWVIPPETEGGDATTQKVMPGWPHTLLSHDRPGTYTYTIRGAGADSKITSAEVNVTVTNAVPRVSIISAPAGDVLEGVPYSLVAKASDADTSDQSFTWNWWVDGVGRSEPGGLTFTYNDPNTRMIPPDQDRISVLYEVEVRDQYEGTSSKASQTVNIARQPFGQTDLVLSSANITVPEGGTASFGVSLLKAPGPSGVMINISDFVAGAGTQMPEMDPDITHSPRSLLFDRENWSTPQTVTLAAKEDADAENGSRSLFVSGPWGTRIAVTATEDDNETTLTLLAEPEQVEASLEGDGVVPKGQWANIMVTPPPGWSLIEWEVDEGDAVLEDAAEVETRAKATEPSVLVARLRECPDLESPAELTLPSVSPTSVNVDWTPVESVEYYQVWLTADVTWASVLRNTTAGAGATSVQFNDLASGTTYYVRVRAVACNEVGGWVEGSFVAQEPTIIATPTSLSVPEGGSSTFLVRLSAQPLATLPVSLGPFTVSGEQRDLDLSISPTTLTFGPSNWSVGQAVTVSAREDNDTTNGLARFSATASGWQAVNVETREIDNDTILKVVADPVAGGTASPSGDTLVTIGQGREIVASAAEGYYFAGWSFEGSGTLGQPIREGSSNRVTATLQGNSTVTAKFGGQLAAPDVLSVAFLAYCDSFSLDWAEVPNAEWYVVDVAYDVNFTQKLPGWDRKEVTVTTATVNGLSPLTTYYARVVAWNKWGQQKEPPATVTVKTSSGEVSSGPSSVTIGDATYSQSVATFSFSWSGVARSALYRWDIVDAGTESTVRSGTVSGTLEGGGNVSVSVDNLAIGRTYYFRCAVQSSCGGLSPYTRTANFTPICPVPSAPSSATVSSLATSGATASATVSWTGVPGAGGYRYQIVRSNNGEVVKQGDVGGGVTSVSVSDLPRGVILYAKVAALNTTCGAEGEYVSSTPFTPAACPVAPSTPGGLSQGVTTYTSSAAATSFSWTGTSGLTYNWRFVNTSTGQAAQSGDATAGSSTGSASNLAIGTAYRFEVRAVNECGLTSGWTQSGSFTPICPMPGVPTGLTQSAPTYKSGVADLMFNWAWISGSSHPWELVNTGTGQVVRSGTLNQPYVQISDVPLDASYRFRVAARNTCGNTSGYAETTGFALACPVPGSTASVTVSNVVTSGSTASATVSWAAVAGAGGYRHQVFRSGDNTAVTTLQTVGATTTSATVTGLPRGVTLYARVEAVNTTCGAVGTHVSSASFTPAACVAASSAPGGLARGTTTYTSTTTANTGFSWTRVSGLTYNWRFVNVGTGVVFSSGEAPADGSSASASGLLLNSTYRFEVWATNECGVSSPVAGSGDFILICPVPGTPGSVSVGSVTTSGSTASATVSWTAVAGAGEYLYQVLRSNGVAFTSVQTAGAGATSATVTGLDRGETYYARVAARNSSCGAVSGYVSSANFSTLACPAAPAGINRGWRVSGKSSMRVVFFP